MYLHLYSTTARSFTLNVSDSLTTVYSALQTPPWGVGLLTIIRRSSIQEEIQEYALHLETPRNSCPTGEST